METDDAGPAQGATKRKLPTRRSKFTPKRKGKAAEPERAPVPPLVVDRSSCTHDCPFGCGATFRDTHGAARHVRNEFGKPGHVIRGVPAAEQRAKCYRMVVPSYAALVHVENPQFDPANLTDQVQHGVPRVHPTGKEAQPDEWTVSHKIGVTFNPTSLLTPMRVAGKQTEGPS